MISPFRTILVVLAVLGLVVAACSDDTDDAPDPGDTTSTTPVDSPTLPGEEPAPSDGTAGDPALAPDMIRIEGTATDGTLDAALDGAATGPFTLQVPSRGGGNGAVINPVSVDGATRSIVWDGGRSLSLDGPDLHLDGHWSVSGGVLAFDLAASAVALPPGTYSLVGPVAVGDPQGLASPADQVTFASGPETALGGTGQASMVVGGGVLLGPGSFELHGAFTVVTATDTVTASTVQLPEGSFELTVAPGGDGVAIQGLAEDATWS